MRKIKIGMFGASGKMGAEILKVIQATDGVIPFLALSRGESISGWDNVEQYGDSKLINEVDVWIDFTLPDAMNDVLKIVKKTKKPLVSGVTGYSEKQIKILKKISATQAILWSSNMSRGIAVIQKMMEQLASLKSFDFQIEEVHHNKKKDRPSGTAKTLQFVLEKAVNKKCPEPLAIRGGGVFGIHKVWAISDEEYVTIEHTALNRGLFAKGAVHAASWMSKKKKGFYNIKDTLEL